MKILIKKNIFMTLLLVFSVFSFLFIRKFSNVKIKKEKFLNVKTEIIQPTSIKKVVSLTSEILPLKSVILKSRINGRIDSMLLGNGEELEENSKIKKDQILTRIENTDLKIKLKQLEASFDIAKANLEVAKVDLENREIDKKRMENLFEKGSITKKKLDLTNVEYKNSVAQLKKSEANLRLAEAKKEEMEYLFGESFIKAPFSGVIDKKYVTEKEIISQNSPIVNIIRTDQYKIIAKLPEKFLPFINDGKEVRLSLYNKNIISKIYKIYPSLDLDSKMLLIEIRVKNDLQDIKPGMLVNIKIPLKEKKKVLTVSTSSLMDNNKIFVVQDDKVYLRTLSLGIRENDRIEITSGLNIDDEVVVMGQHNLKEGDLVKRVVD
ncbi:MAG: hypothetical protein AMS24_03480 [Chlamydiae bacterium SM23_39]|nr:MAG: hypothetical protein AMS24_03480 [Chlamydiae bacterium SM23_39]